jgi:hypothetical protein
MSFTWILALCILCCDFLVYALFRWTYPDRGEEARGSGTPTASHLRHYSMHSAGKWR